jgi:hypothetical protein
VGVDHSLRHLLRWNGWALIAVALVAFAFVAFNQTLFNDGDTYWHIGAGRWISEHYVVPTVDPFSFTARGRAWTAHEWLSEIIMASAFAAGSWGGVQLLFGCAVAATLLLVGLELRRYMPPLRAAAAMIFLFIFLEPSLLPRPHALAWPLVAAWTLVLIRARERHKAPPLAAALLMLVWANLHGSFVFGLVMLPFFGLEALLRESNSRAVVWEWGAFTLVSVAATLANPSGLQALLFAFQISSMKILPLISEWRPSSLSKDPLFFAMTALGVLLLLIRRPRISVPRLLLIALLFYLALTHARHQALFGLVSLLLVAPSLGRGAEGGAADPAAVRQPAIAGVCALVILLLSVARLSLTVPHKDTPVYPGRAIASVPFQLRAQPVLNAYDFGGALILNGIAPFIDGRADMYGDAFVADAHAIERGDAPRFNAAVKQWNIRWTILHPDEGLVAVLDHDPSWRRVYADEYAVIHVRR